MKKLVFILFGFSLLVLISFTKNSTTTETSFEAMAGETLIGDWTYESVIRNGELVSLDSCDEMDVLKFDPSGRFESLQHISLINVISGEGTTTNCSSIQTNGSWSVTPKGELLRNDQSMEIFEITETTLKLKTVVMSVDEEGKTVKDIYVDCYTKR